MGIVLLSAGFLAYLFSLLKQPLIPGYILAGVFVGPILGIITSSENIMLLAEIGIAFLLFSVGLEVSFKNLKLTLGTAAVIGIIKTLIAFSLGYFIAVWIGFSNLVAIYFSFLVSFSSTMVLVKIFSDKNELETLHARIVVTILLIEDIFAIIALAILTNLNTIFSGFNITPLLSNLALISGLIIGTILITPFLFKQAAKNPELLFVLSVSLALAFAIIFNAIGLSIAIGAFIAGLILGNLPYNLEILARIKPLKDFFGVLFFASIGLSMRLVDLHAILKPLLIVIAFNVIITPSIIIILMILNGFDKKPSFLTASSMSQVSEFSLIIAFQGLALGHVNSSFISLTVLSAIITMSLTAYILKFNRVFYKFSIPILKFLSYFKKTRHFETIIKKHYPVVLVGYDRTGFSILKTLLKLNRDVIVIDYNPEVIQNLVQAGIPCIYGDASDPEILERLKLKDIEMLVSTIPDTKDNLFLIREVREKNKKTLLFVTATTIDDALELYEAGADYVILPHFLGGEHASLLLEEASVDIDKLITTKLQHIRELKMRKHLHPKH